jgi:3-oxoacyl-[acyl-carrier protein] reductase
MFDLTGKVALVTGASRGIGRGVALSLAKQGADVVVNYAGNVEGASQTVSEVTAMGRRAIAIKADVSKKSEVVAMVNEAVKQMGKIDILVNNAGVLSYQAFVDMPEEEWDKIIDTNLKGQFLVGQAVSKHMVDNGIKGKIINIASIASGQVGVGYPSLSHYCASKGGVIAMSEAMAVELGPKGINVNVIAPGAIDTDMAKSLSDPKVMEGLLSRLSIKRIGKPEDIGAMAVFLAAEESSYCSGVTFYVDGGWLAG